MTFSIVCATTTVRLSRSRSTGKERDAESGNDYFGARYYASTMGRFMSPDWSAKVMPVPYAKLDNPQSLNLYSYVWNNPLSRNDPDGHYKCGSSQDECAAIKTRMDLARAAVSKLGADSVGGKAIQKVLNFYGPEGKDNGVYVSAGKLEAGNLGKEILGPNGTVNITLDLGQINAAARNSSMGGVFGLSEGAGAVIHEGEHGVDDRARGHEMTTRKEVDATEHKAYRTESYVFQGLGANSAQGLWNANWTPAETEQNRSSAIDAAAAGSVAADCAGGVCK